MPNIAQPGNLPAHQSVEVSQYAKESQDQSRPPQTHEAGHMQLTSYEEYKTGHANQTVFQQNVAHVASTPFANQGPAPFSMHPPSINPPLGMTPQPLPVPPPLSVPLGSNMPDMHEQQLFHEF